MQVITDISKEGKTIYETNSKRIFNTIPKPPYDIGDLWIAGALSDMKQCIYKRTVGSYEESDWDYASKYANDIASLVTDVSTAQASADTANSLLADLSSDNKLTAVEKQEVKKEWTAIVSEKPLNDTQADTFSITTEKNTYDTNYTTLYNYITPLLVSLETTSDIVGPTFRTNFKNYYDARTNLLNAISVKAKALADAAQTTANTAQNTADTANTLATQKKRVFTTTPATNEAYDIGDLWADGTVIKKCKTAKAVGQAYSSSHWELAASWTDDTTANSALSIANQKRRCFTTTPTVPYNVGDLWSEGSDGDLKIAAVQRLTGSFTASDWNLASKYTDDTEANKAVKYYSVVSKIMRLGGTDNGNGSLEIYNQDGVKTGTFDKEGVSLESGDFTILEDDFKCTTLQLNNLINDHSFELLEILGSKDPTYYDYDFTTTSNSFLWNKVSGSPRLISNIGTDITSSAKYGNQAIVVNSSNNISQYQYLKANTEYTITGYSMRSLRSLASGTARITINCYDETDSLLSTQSSDFSNLSTTEYKRLKYTFTTHASSYIVEILLQSSNSNYVVWDGIQLVDGDTPSIYNSENQLWSYINDLIFKPNDIHIPNINIGTKIKLIKTSNQGPIAVNTTTTVTWDSVESNSSEELSKNGNKIVIGKNIRTVLVIAQYQASQTNNGKYIYIFKNNTLVCSGFVPVAASSLSIIQTLEVEEGDEIDIRCYFESNAGTIGFYTNWTYFTVTVLS